MWSLVFFTCKIHGFQDVIGSISTLLWLYFPLYTTYFMVSIFNTFHINNFIFFNFLFYQLPVNIQLMINKILVFFVCIGIVYKNVYLINIIISSYIRQFSSLYTENNIRNVPSEAWNLIKVINNEWDNCSKL